jgi:hypothetical protein
MSVSIYNNSSFSDTPFGLKLQQTITGSGAMGVATGSSVIPAGIQRVYAVCIGGGGGGGSSAQAGGGGGAGAFSAGWTYVATVCTVDRKSVV